MDSVRFQCIARHDRQTCVALSRLLARLNNHSSRFEFHQCIVRLGLIQGNVHHQPRRFLAGFRIFTVFPFRKIAHFRKSGDHPESTPTNDHVFARCPWSVGGTD
jgi:hypothetical protein